MTGLLLHLVSIRPVSIIAVYIRHLHTKSWENLIQVEINPPINLTYIISVKFKDEGYVVGLANVRLIN